MRAVLVPVLSGGLTAEASALFAKMTTQPTASRKLAINKLIVDLKNAGIWSQLDALYMLAANDEQASRINWKNPANSLTAINAPTFTANSGWDFASTKSLSTGYDYVAGVAGGKYLLSNCHAFTFSLTNAAGSTRFDIGCATVGSLFIGSRMTTGLGGRLNFGTGGDSDVATVATSVGMSMLNRTDNTTCQYVKDGVVLVPRAVAAGAICDNICIGNGSTSGTQYSNRRLGAAGFGGGLQTSQLPAYYSAVYGYLHSVGAI